MAAKHLVRTAQNFLRGAFPLLLGVDDHRLGDAVEALFRPDGVYVELRAKREGNSGSSELHCTSLLQHLYKKNDCTINLVENQTRADVVLAAAYRVVGETGVSCYSWRQQGPSSNLLNKTCRATQHGRNSIEPLSPFGLNMSNTTQKNTTINSTTGQIFVYLCRVRDL